MHAWTGGKRRKLLLQQKQHVPAQQTKMRNSAAANFYDSLLGQQEPGMLGSSISAPTALRAPLVPLPAGDLSTSSRQAAALYNMQQAEPRMQRPTTVAASSHLDNPECILESAKQAIHMGLADGLQAQGTATSRSQASDAADWMATSGECVPDPSPASTVQTSAQHVWQSVKLADYASAEADVQHEGKVSAAAVAYQTTATAPEQARLHSKANAIASQSDRKLARIPAAMRLFNASKTDQHRIQGLAGSLDLHMMLGHGSTM